jgi:hypothetical protein
VPVKAREAKERRPVFTDEVLSLFRELERVPKRRRWQPKWRTKSKRLAALLGLSIEFWTMNTVNDTGGPCGPEGGASREAWQACRQMRVRLLAAARLGRTVCGPKPASWAHPSDDHTSIR